MPIPSKPPVLRNVIGYNADVFSLPDKSVDGSGALSYESGWPRITATSLKAGGKAPQREYFNQVNKLLSQHIFFQQSGNIYDWNASLNYNAGAHVLGSDGLEYVAVSPSGPDVPGVGAKDPAGSRNKSQWLLLAALLMSSDGGLVVDPVTGKGAVDFEKMPPDKIENLLKQIRVPIWLTKNSYFYVDGRTGSDTIDPRRGESAAKPFKTIQAAIDYVTENFNLATYTTTLSVKAGDYDERLTLRQYQTSGGDIIIKADGGKIGLQGGIQAPYAAKYRLIGISFATKDKYKSESNTLTHVRVANSAAEVLASQCDFLPIESDATCTGVWVSGGTFAIYDECSWSGEYSALWLVQQPTSILNLARDTSFFNVATTAVLDCSSGSLFSRTGTTDGGPAIISGNATGMRYKGATNAIINTRGGGPDFLPGTEAGIVGTGAQYV